MPPLAGKIRSMNTNHQRSLFVGVDPGKGGGIAVIDGARRIIHVSAMGEDEFEMERNFQYLIQILEEHKKKHGADTVSISAVLEKVHSMPQQSAQSGFTFGQWFGMASVLLRCVCGISTNLVPPQEWMKGLGIPQGKEMKKDRKKFLRSIAIGLFPKSDIWDHTMGYQLKISDALLLAEYARTLFVKG